MADRPAGDTQVLIVGAGPTGLVLALWLKKLGVRVRIIDKTADAAPFSRALGVHARTLEFYRMLGFADAVVDAGVVMPGINLWVKHAKTARLPFQNVGGGLTPYPFVLDFAQDQHERLLIAQLSKAGVTVERRTELIGFDQEGDAVRAVLKIADGGEETVRAAYIAGCDGAHSIVRAVTAIGFDGGSYEKLFYVADVEASGPAVDGELHVDLDVADLLAVFAMKGVGHIRLVGTVRPDAGQGGREPTFEDVSNRPFEQMRITISKVNWFSTYRVHHRVATTFRKGRAFLLGDAAHIHSPVGAQGMNTGIGDAVNLSWKLAAVLAGAPESLLHTYEIERIAFARRLVATTDRAFSIATKQGRVAAFVRTRLFPIIAASLFRLRAARRFLFRTVSQIEINYRLSPLSVGQAGRVRGGDRLPWVANARSETFADNFAPLASLTWQVHVYGEPKSGVAEACADLGLPLHAFAWTPEMKRAGLERGAVYLIRPDAYVALADVTGMPRPLTEYSSAQRTVRNR
jgi:2-polyprenyl-6-methoxyphenol hydroxylase-like FAD-dependent oxidoreductase